MSRLFFRVLLRLAGWNAVSYPVILPERFVLIVAPHTSMWDFVWGYCFMREMRLKVKFLIKHEVFFFPLGPLLKWLGGLPVDRGRGSTMVQQVVEAFDSSRKLVVAITPEGTRKPTRKWKRGFYRIATSAAVPVAVGYVDYATKTYGIPLLFTPTGNYTSDMEKVTEVFHNRTGKHPEMFLLPDITNEGKES
jgi:1-acyl-sn-glycerol-3-phosphate acyltransferase